MFNKLKLALAALAVMVTSVANAATHYVDKPYPVTESKACLIQISSTDIVNRNFVIKAHVPVTERHYLYKKEVETNVVHVQVVGQSTIRIQFYDRSSAVNWVINVFPRLPCLK